jgi:acetyl esterase/lipase
MLLLIITSQVFLVSCNRPIKERLKTSRINKTNEKRSIHGASETAGEFMDDGSSIMPEDLKLPDRGTVFRNIPYGKDALQRMDIYQPRRVPKSHPSHIKIKLSPVILMVHGGAWRTGDKSSKSVIQNKVNRWVSKGFVFVSVNYRMLPGTGPLEQSQDVIKALAFAQSQAEMWGGDSKKFILMGHSAGAHLASLIASSPEKAFKEGALPWLGTVSLDSAALDVGSIMKSKHFKFYDAAFGSDPAYWIKSSPYDQLNEGPVARMAPYLAVCSLKRSDSIAQSSKFVRQVNALGGKAEILKQDLSHKDINQQLGILGEYTYAVESFMKKLDKSVAEPLK